MFLASTPRFPSRQSGAFASLAVAVVLSSAGCGKEGARGPAFYAPVTTDGGRLVVAPDESTAAAWDPCSSLAGLPVAGTPDAAPGNAAVWSARDAGAGPDGALSGDGPRLTGRPVLLVSLDGLRPDAIVRARARTLMRLACQGAFSWRAATIAPSLTLPAHSSMLSGYPAEKHTFFHDYFLEGSLPVPTVASIAKGAGLRVMMIIGKDKLLQLAAPGSLDVFALEAASDEAVAERAIAEARTGFDFLFVHFGWIDLVGHSYGWMSPEYLDRVAATDALLGRLLATLPPEVTVIVSSDHGGKGTVHWSGAREDFVIPWIIHGPGVRAGLALRSPVSTMDTAATVAALLGVALPTDVSGVAVTEALR